MVVQKSWVYVGADGGESTEIKLHGREVKGEGNKMIWKWPWKARHILILCSGCVTWAGYERKKKVICFQVAAMEAKF